METMDFLFIMLIIILLVILFYSWKKENFWAGTPLPYAGQPIQKWGRYAVQAQTPIPILMTDPEAKCINPTCGAMI